jgi:UDP-N-acetylmuramoyl-L-alanyl-D-glutamate--2,6-diaminopimelate ligase
MSTPALAPPPPALRAHVHRWLQAHAAPRADLQIDSRRVAPGDVFVALAGRRADGRQFLEQAAARGAAAALVEEDAWAAPADVPVPVLPVPALAQGVAWFAADHYGDPGAQLRSVGITGTNGKTSSCQWVAQLLGDCGQRCATIGTLGYGFPGALDEREIHLTTPDAVSLQRLARRARDAGASALSLEVSSIGLAQGRTAAWRFEVALFTNLTRDHLDYHGDMAAYGAAKRRLFAWPGLATAVLNCDDAFGRRIVGELLAERALGARRLRVVGTGAAAGSDAALDLRLHAEAVLHRPEGLAFTLVAQAAEAPTQRLAVQTALLGDFNVANLLGVLGVAWACGIDLARAVGAAARLQPPAGRLQRANESADARAPLAIVDYAHTPDAILQALRALRPLAQARAGRLWIVFGAGGDRDPGKRPAMAAAAAAAADVLVLTSDNPRSEDPQAILAQLAAGLPAGSTARREADRGRAIAQALAEAAPADVVLIAGKGHEAYQEIAGQRLPFSDLAVARAALRQREAP